MIKREVCDKKIYDCGQESLDYVSLLLALVHHHVGFGDANELGHCLLDMKILNLVPLLCAL